MEVDVPVAVSCVPLRLTAPQWNVPHLAPDAFVTQKLKAELADLALAQGYIGELEAELIACR